MREQTEVDRREGPLAHKQKEHVKVVQIHQPDLVRAISSTSQRSIWARCSAAAVEAHVGEPKASTQDVQHRHAVGEGSLDAVPTAGRQDLHAVEEQQWRQSEETDAEQNNMRRSSRNLR